MTCMLLDVAPGPFDTSSPLTVILVAMFAIAVIGIALWALFRKRPPRA